MLSEQSVADGRALPEDLGSWSEILRRSLPPSCLTLLQQHLIFILRFLAFQSIPSKR